MRRLALLLSIGALGLVLALPSVAQAQVSEDVAVDAIYTHFDADEAAFAVAVSECETGLGDDIYNEWGGAHGILQIMPETAYEMGYDYSALSDPYYAAWAAKDLHDYTESLGLWGFSPWACAY